MLLNMIENINEEKKKGVSILSKITREIFLQSQDLRNIKSNIQFDSTMNGVKRWF